MAVTCLLKIKRKKHDMQTLCHSMRPVRSRLTLRNNSHLSLLAGQMKGRECVYLYINTCTLWKLWSGPVSLRDLLLQCLHPCQTAAASQQVRAFCDRGLI